MRSIALAVLLAWSWTSSADPVSCDQMPARRVGIHNLRVVGASSAAIENNSVAAGPYDPVDDATIIAPLPALHA